MKRTYVLGAVVMTQVNLFDQFQKPVDWRSFESVPKVLVFAGKDAAADGKKWGAFLQETYNPKFQPTVDHLRSLQPAEQVKVVAVASLPDVPGIFKGLFRSGFRRESKDMGVILDFDHQLSRQFQYDGSDAIPTVVVLPRGAFNEGSRHLQFRASPDAQAERDRVKLAVDAYLKEPAPEASPVRAR